MKENIKHLQDGEYKRVMGETEVDLGDAVLVVLTERQVKQFFKKVKKDEGN